MNVTAVETLERRLKATRDAMQGELERARNARAQAEKAEQRAEEHRQVIADLELALDEIRGWTPPAGDGLLPPYDVRCPSCDAKVGEFCRSPTGEPLEQPHATRRAPA